jgi:hypothetical protein
VYIENPLKRRHPDPTVPNHLPKDSPGKEPSKTTNGAGVGKPVPRAVIFPEASEKALPMSREFAEEFHKSVLQTTRQQQEHKAGEFWRPTSTAVLLRLTLRSYLSAMRQNNHIALLAYS